MIDKPPLWADLLLTFWVLVVAVIFFGVYFVPAIGLWTDAGAGVYTLMVLVSVVILAVKYLKRGDAPKADILKTPPQEAAKPRKLKDTRTKTRE